MKILFTGGGTAGHFYPLIAIAEEVIRIADEEKLVKPSLYYMAPNVTDKKLLFDNDITFIRVVSGKSRLYFSLKNVLDVVKLAVGIVTALLRMFSVYPDIVVSKGGYGSVPAVFAARLLRIPIFIHESDSVPGRANIWAAKFAKRVALSWPEAEVYFPKNKTAVVGQPVVREILSPIRQGAGEYLKLEEGVPVLFILGGSQGAKKINDSVFEILPQLVEKYQIIHQTGKRHIKEALEMESVVLSGSELRRRYKPFGFLNTLALRMTAGIASLVISRAGSSIFEIAAWGLPSIIVPIATSHGDHQRRNAFNYARSGGAVVIEEKNLTPNVLLSEITRLMEHEEERERMSKAAKGFFEEGAARKIAQEAIKIALEHER